MSESEPAWRVLAVFDRACDLVTRESDVIALVLPDIGDGPLNVVVEGRAGAFAAAIPGMTAGLEGTQLQIGMLRVALGQAQIWEPRPDWERLRRNRVGIESRLPLLRSCVLQCSPRGSLLDLLSIEPDLADFGKPVRSGLATFHQALLDLEAGWAGNLARLQAGAERLAGLGSGLTPAGDDFLTGVMLWAWLAHPEPIPFCHAMLETAAPCTTTLSTALLRAAARGECSAPWQHLLSNLEDGRRELIAAMAEDVLAHGFTSGADTLAGLLWMGCQSLPHQNRSSSD